MFSGYARVSSDGQSLEAQLEELKAAGCGQVFREKMSGARSDRPQLAKLLAILTPGDCLVVTRLDRLARSSRDLLNVTRLLPREPRSVLLAILGPTRRRLTEG